MKIIEDKEIFEFGDIVILRSGGPAMVIYDICYETDTVYCSWITGFAHMEKVSYSFRSWEIRLFTKTDKKSLRD